MMNGAKIKRMKPDALDQIYGKLKKIGQKEIAIGYPAEKAQAYPDGTPVVEVAAAQVFGIGVIERDFMSLAKATMIPKVQPILKKIAQLAIKPNSTSSDAQALKNLLELAGQIGQAEIRAASVDGAWEPNSTNPMSEHLRMIVSESWGKDIPHGMSYAEAKQKFRGSDKPLVDTGHLAASATYIVRDKTT